MIRSVSIAWQPFVGVSLDWERQHQRRWNEYITLVIGYVGLLVYGSLIPFHFKPLGHPLDLIADLPAWLASPRWWSIAELAHYNTYGTSNPYSNDWFNLLLYVPLGLLACLAWRRHGWGITRRILAATLLGVITSWIIECTQGLTVDRIASLNDILTNGLGAMIGALAADGAVEGFKRMIFWCYCRIAHQLHRLVDFIRSHRGRPVLVIPIMALNLIALGLWYLAQWKSDPGMGAAQHAVNWLPFYAQFDLPYESAMLQIARSLVVYLLLASLLSLQWVSMRPRQGISLVLLVTAALVGAYELIRLLGRGHRADMTEPALAVLAGLMLTVLVFALVRAIRVSCRRKQQVQVPIERRRRSHHYLAPSR